MLLERHLPSESRLAVWHITEPEKWFHTRLILDPADLDALAKLRHPRRRLQWLSSRWLVRHVMGNPSEAISLCADDNGKPYIKNFTINISLSHSADLSAVLISPHAAVGVDLEYVHPRIVQLRHRFLNETELRQLSDPEDVPELCACWCAKEALYKLYGKKQLDFKRHLFLDLTGVDLPGKITGRINKPPHHSRHDIYVEFVQGFTLAYAIGSLT